MKSFAFKKADLRISSTLAAVDLEEKRLSTAAEISGDFIASATVSSKTACSRYFDQKTRSSASEIRMWTLGVEQDVNIPQFVPHRLHKNKQSLMEEKVRAQRDISGQKVVKDAPWWSKL